MYLSKCVCHLINLVLILATQRKRIFISVCIVFFFFSFLLALDWFELYCPCFPYVFVPHRLPSLLLPLVSFIRPPPLFILLHHPLYLTSSSPPFFIPPLPPVCIVPFLPIVFLPTFLLYVNQRWDGESDSIERGLKRPVGVRDTEWTVCALEREREKKQWGRNRNSFHLHSLDPLRAGPWRMTKPVFSLSHSFSWMFSADKVFASKTNPPLR